ncbi:MAG TPA: diguanylate cyclase, partial [Coleofasciculaceae cyanobacterium]
VVQAIRHSLDLEQVFVTATHEVARLLQADRAEIVQYFSDRQIWRNVADHRHIPNLPNRLGKEITDFERAVDAQLKRLEIVRFDTLQPMSESTNLGQTELVQRFTSSHCTGAWLLIPLMTEGSLWGCLSLNRNCDRPTWQDAEVDLAMVVADQVAVAIQQSELYQKLQIANQELQHLAKLDGLTQIGNRRCFNDYLTQEWLRMAREQGPISLILCDVDYFKLYNDTYGHLAGDTCLIQIARAIGRAVKRPADLATRYGGEEFAVILPNTDIQGALQVAQAIRNEVQRLGLRHDASPVKERVTLSLGIASAFPTPHSRFEELLDASDRALYCAKASGRDRFHFHNLTELQEA